MGNLFKKPNTRRVLFTALTVFVALALLALNLLFIAYADRTNLALDMTSEGRYTVRARMIEILKEADIRQDVDVIFCTTQDRVLQNSETSLVYRTCVELEKALPFFHVSCVDAKAHPEAVEAYKRTSATSIGETNVILTSGTEYRTYKAATFYTVDETSEEVLGYNGEQKLCEGILSLTAKDLPIACFTTGHGETVPERNSEETGDLYDVVRSAGFAVMTVDLEKEDIPDNCTLLFINAPTADFPSSHLMDVSYESPITKIDRFLDRFGTLLYFRNAAAPALPNLEEYIAEWGIGFSVLDPVGTPFSSLTVTDSTASVGGNAAVISGQYGTSSAYSDLTALSSPPKTVFANAQGMRVLFLDGFSAVNNYGRTVTTLFSTDQNAEARNGVGDTVASGTFPLMTMTSETRVVDSEYVTANVIVCATGEYLSPAYLGEPSYANAEVLASILRGTGRTVVSVADELEFKYYQSLAFTDTDDEIDNTVYNRDSDGNVIWITDPATGVSEHSVNRILRQLGEGERTVLTLLLVLLPPAVALGVGGFVVLRRKNR